MQNNMTSERQKTEIPSMLLKFSHEIRNPLTLISSELQMMARDHPEIVSYQGWDMVMENIEHIRDLLNELSRYGGARALSRTFPLSEDFLRSVAASVEPTLNYLGIRLKTEIHSPLPPLLIDRVKMRQALINLLRNAQESISGPEGEILLRADTWEGKVRISVSDNGCGMSREQLDRIFTPFVTFKPSGTGLGLPVTRQIIEAHGGTLTAESRPDQGSAFCILLG